MRRSVASDLRLLIGGRIQRARGAVRSAGRAGWVRAALVVIGGLLFTGALYGGAYRFLYWIIARTDYVGGLLTAVLLDYLMLIALGILLLSSFIAALAEVLLSDDLVLLRAAPMREEALFLDRLLMIWLQTAWMPVTFVVPVVLGFARAWSRLITETPGTGTEPDAFALAILLGIGLPALTLVPAALSSMGALLVGRYISANRLRNAMLVGAIVGGMGLYAGGQYLRLDRVLSPEGIDNFIESVRSMDRSEVRWLPTDWLSHSVDIALHGDLAALGFYSDRGLAEERTDKLLEDTLKATGDRPWLRLGLEGLIYSRRRNAEPSLLDNLRTLAGKLPFVSMQKPPEKPPLWPPFALIGMGLVLTLLGVFVARRSYAIAYGQSQTGQPEHKPKGTQAVTRYVHGLRRLMPHQLAPFMLKDALIFTRDATQWTQALVIAGMIALSGWGFAAAADRSNLTQLSEVLPYARVVLFGIGAWIGTLLTSAAAARLVFPLVSLEGESFWLVRAAPITMRRLLLAKLATALLPTILLGCSIAWVVCSALQFTPQLTTMAVAMSLGNAIVTCCLGVGLGAAMPDFRFVNVSQLVQGPGGILFIVLSMTYATILTGFCSSYVYIEARGITTLTRQIALLGLPILIGLVMAASALKLGLNRLSALQR